jgi:hypothetical protein
MNKILKLLKYQNIKANSFMNDLNYSGLSRVIYKCELFMTNLEKNRIIIKGRIMGI